MKDLKWLAICVCALILTACQTLDSAIDGAINDISDARAGAGDAFSASSPGSLISRGSCPQVEIVDELATLREYSKMNAPGADNLISEATVSTIDFSCEYKHKTVQVDVKLLFEGKLGPKVRRTENDKPFFSYPYFIAIARPSGTIMAKEVFSAPMGYEKNQNSFDYYEGIRQIIPLNSSGKGSGYKILVGFQLSERQLEINREIAKAELAVERAKKAAEIQADVERIREEARQKRLEEEAAQTPAMPASNVGPATPGGPIILNPGN